MVLKHPPRSHDDADEESSNSSVRHANCLSICSSAGLEIGTVELESDKGKSIVGMGWSDHEHLITVLENGKRYDNVYGCRCVLRYNTVRQPQLSFAQFLPI